MTGGTVPLPLLEMVGVHVFALRGSSSNNLIPLDGLDMTQVVVVQDTDTAFQNI